MNGPFYARPSQNRGEFYCIVPIRPLGIAPFRASFSGYDLLWFGLAALTAFRLGSGGSES